MRSRTVWAVLDAIAARFPDAAALKQPTGGGQYRTWTFTEYRDTVRELAVGLRTLGVQHGDIVGLQSETRAEFYLADLAVMSAGAVAAAVYTSLPPAAQAQALVNTGARVVFAENEKSMRALQSAAGSAFNPHWILLTGTGAASQESPSGVSPAGLGRSGGTSSSASAAAAAGSDGSAGAAAAAGSDGSASVPAAGGSACSTFEDIRAAGVRALAEDPTAFQQICDEFNDSAMAILYMTSGATGEPTMGLVTHRALVSNIDMGPQALPLSPADSTIAFLPSAHIAQRVVVELLPLREGACVWFSESLAKLPSELRSIRPTFFLAPPRVWERVFSSVSAEIKKRPAVIRKLFYMGVGLGAEVARLREQRKPIPAWMRTSLALIDRVMFAKIRERLGGRIRVAASGAAPLGKDLASFYAAIGIPLIEGYGLTEGGVVTLNPLDRPKSGSIGKLLPGVEARLEEDGELMLRGPCLFEGYFNDPAATAAVLREGWLATGDIAETDAEGYFFITGRKKEIIVSSNGKKIYPSRIEALLKREPLVSQVLLIGDKLPYVTALFSVHGKPEEAKAAVERAVKATNRELPSFEQIRKFKLLDREFSIEQGELTPTMKLRRGRTLENHRALVGEMYVGRDVD